LIIWCHIDIVRRGWEKSDGHGGGGRGFLYTFRALRCAATYLVLLINCIFHNYLEGRERECCKRCPVRYLPASEGERLRGFVSYWSATVVGAFSCSINFPVWYTTILQKSGKKKSSEMFAQLLKSLKWCSITIWNILGLLGFLSVIWRLNTWNRRNLWLKNSAAIFVELNPEPQNTSCRYMSWHYSFKYTTAFNKVEARMKGHYGGIWGIFVTFLCMRIFTPLD
jgi:hypothetical protein